MTIRVVIVSALVIGGALWALKSFNSGWLHESPNKKAEESKKSFFKVTITEQRRHI